METKFIEATQPAKQNWGKFMLARFTTKEWAYQSTVDQRPLLHARGWCAHHILITDLQTGEGAIFQPGGSARHDLNKRRIWVCPMFEPFLEWLYQQDVTDLSKLPAYVEIEAPFALAGYRRPGAPTSEVEPKTKRTKPVCHL